MSPQAGWILQEEVVPRLRASIPRNVSYVGSEDSEELIQDGTVLAAKMLHNAELAGKQVTPGNIAYYTILHMKSGRRSTGHSNADVLGTATQLNGRSGLHSFDEPIEGDELGEIFTVNDVFSNDGEDPGQIAARKMDWEAFLAGLTAREKAVVKYLLEGRTVSDVAWAFKVSRSTMQKCKERLVKLIREFMGADIGGSAAHQLASAVAAWNPYKPDRVADYFDPESMFGVRDGFDITIGNPPYVRADEQSEWNQRQREKILASEQYETLWEKWDLFVPFIERAYKLLKPGGVTTLIVSDAFCHSKYAQKPQNWFLKNARILRLDFCSDLQIFDAAVHNLIYFFQRADGTRHTPDRRVHRETFGNVVTLPSDEQAKLTYRAFFPETSEQTSFAAPVIPIEQICYVSFGCRPNSDEKVAKGLFVAADLVSDQEDEDHPKPYIEAKDITRWTYQQYRWLEWGTDRSPDLLTRPTFEQLYEVPEKIVAADVSGAENRAAYDSAQVFHSHTLISFVPWHSLNGVRNNSLKKSARYRGERPPRPDLPKREELEDTSRRFAVKYLLGVMNSSAARDFLRANRRSNIHLYPDDWKKLPIPDVPPAQQEPIVTLVDQILTAKRANRDADISALEADLDAKVNSLYGIPTTIFLKGHLVGTSSLKGTLTVTPSSPPSSSPSASSSSPSSPSSSSSPSSPSSGGPSRFRRTEAGMKDLLRDRILPRLSLQAPYFSIEAIRAGLEEARCPLEPTTLNSYLHELSKHRELLSRQPSTILHFSQDARCCCSSSARIVRHFCAVF